MPTVVINSDRDTSYDCLFGDEWLVLHEGSSDSLYIPWDDVNLILLVGDSTDVDPSLYGETKSDECGSTDKLQDLEAFRFLDRAVEKNLPIVGICKGAQQMCVYHYGRLVQHVPRVGAHNTEVVDNLNPVFDDATPAFFEWVPADHHQVMVPSAHGVTLYVNEEEGHPDVVVFPYQQLAVQWHPEWATEESGARVLFSELVEAICRVSL